MAEKPSLTIIEDEDLGLTVAPSGKKDDPNPVDSLTGEAMFDDIDPRFSITEVDETPAKKKRIEVGDEEDGEEQEELAEGDDELETDEDEEEEETPRGNKAVRSRIARERRLREESEANYRDLKSDVDELRAQLNKNASDEEFTSKKATLESEIAGIRTDLTAAIEAGDSAKQVELQDKLAEKRGELIAARTLHEGAKASADKVKTTASTIVQRKVSQWIRKHPRFNRDPEFGDIARVIDRQVAKDGYDPETDEFYEEVDKRLSKRFPDEYKGRRKDEDEEGSKRRNKPPSQSFRREPGGSKIRKLGNFEVRGGKIRLTESQVTNMKKFGFDPANPEDVRDYISNNIPSRRA